MTIKTGSDNIVYKTFIKNSFFYFMSALMANTSLFLINVILARLLGTGDYAVIVLLMSIVGTCVVLSNLGVSDAITKFIAEHTDRDEISALVSAGMGIFLVLSVSAATALFAFAGHISHVVFKGDMTLYIRLATVWVLCFSFIVFIKGVGMGLHRTNFVILGDLLYNPPRLLYIVGLLAFGISIERIVIGWTALLLAGVTIIIFYFKGFADREGIKLRLPSLGTTKKVLRYGAYLYLPFLSIFMIKYALTLQIGTFSSKQDVSFFAVSMSLVAVSFLLFVPIAKMLMPTVSRIYKSGDHDKLEVIGRVLLKYIGVASVLIASVFCFANTTILRLVYGKAYTGASTILAILALGIFFETIKFITDPLLNGTKYASTVSHIEVFKLIVTITAGFLLIHAYGALGAAAAFLAGAVISCLLKLVMVNRRLGINLSSESLRIFIIFAFLLISLACGLSLTLFLSAGILFAVFSRLVSLKEIKTIYSLIST